MLFGIFVAVPILLYAEFKSADDDKRQLLRTLVQEQGRLIAQSLRPMLEQQQGKSIPDLSNRLARLSDGRIRVRLLFRPTTNGKAGNFYFVGSVPAVSASRLSRARAELIRTGILDKLQGSCAGNIPLAMRYTNPAGEKEVLTSVTPVNAATGCWVVITSYATADVIGSSIARPYWQNPEIQFAAAIYLLMALIVMSLFLGVWRSLHRFQKLARDIRTERAHQTSFARLNEVPELGGVAREFDNLVNTLESSAESIRHAAEDNTHAFKTPIAVIRQSLEPLRRAAGRAGPREQRALELIEKSVVRLDRLVSAARRMDETNAELVDPPREVIDLSAVLERILSGYAETARDRGLGLLHKLEPGVMVMASEELVETVVENLLDNAMSFSPPDSAITVTLTRRDGSVDLSVHDQGSGSDPKYLSRLFERYYTSREASPEMPAKIGVGGYELVAQRVDDDRSAHSGIGLWIVRRNVEAIGGTVTAKNLPGRGLGVRVSIPIQE